MAVLRGLTRSDRRGSSTSLGSALGKPLRSAPVRISPTVRVTTLTGSTPQQHMLPRHLVGARSRSDSVASAPPGPIGAGVTATGVSTSVNSGSTLSSAAAQRAGEASPNSSDANSGSSRGGAVATGSAKASAQASAQASAGAPATASATTAAVPVQGHRPPPRYSLIKRGATAPAAAAASNGQDSSSEVREGGEAESPGAGAHAAARRVATLSCLLGEESII